MSYADGVIIAGFLFLVGCGFIAAAAAVDTVVQRAIRNRRYRRIQNGGKW